MGADTNANSTLTTLLGSQAAQSALKSLTGMPSMQQNVTQNAPAQSAAAQPQQAPQMPAAQQPQANPLMTFAQNPQMLAMALAALGGGGGGVQM